MIRKLNEGRVYIAKSDQYAINEDTTTSDIFYFLINDIGGGYKAVKEVQKLINEYKFKLDNDE